MASLIILRGLPGSGKSTLAHELSETGKYPVYSIDDYFTGANGDYRFEFEKNHLAYKHCEENTRRSMKEKAEKIFLANVFSLDWEIEPYFKLAAEFNYRVFIVTVEKHHGEKNIHDIPHEQLEKIAQKYKVKLY